MILAGLWVVRMNVGQVKIRKEFRARKERPDILGDQSLEDWRQETGYSEMSDSVDDPHQGKRMFALSSLEERSQRDRWMERLRS